MPWNLETEPTRMDRPLLAWTIAIIRILGYSGIVTGSLWTGLYVAFAVRFWGDPRCTGSDLLEGFWRRVLGGPLWYLLAGLSIVFLSRVVERVAGHRSRS
jgi:hypothetical protein